MHFGTILPAPTWLSTDELKRYNKLKRSFVRMAKDREIPMDPFLALYIQDVVVTTLYIQRGESALMINESAPEAEQSTAKPASAKITPSVMDALAKQRERLRKAMKELTVYLDKAEERAKEGQPKNFLDYYATLIAEAEEVTAESRKEYAAYKAEQTKAQLNSETEAEAETEVAKVTEKPEVTQEETVTEIVKSEEVAPEPIQEEAKTEKPREKPFPSPTMAILVPSNENRGINVSDYLWQNSKHRRAKQNSRELEVAGVG